MDIYRYMKPKPQIDFLVEEFFNTGKLVLNEVFNDTHLSELLSSNNIDDLRNALNRWNSLSDYGKEDMVYGDMLMVDKMEEIEEIVNTFNFIEKSDQTYLNKLNKIEELFKNYGIEEHYIELYKILAEKQEEYKKTISGVVDKIDTQTEKDEEERKEEIDTSNVEDLPILQQGQYINNPTNLTTLQFILLNNYVDKESVEDRKKLNKEIKDKIFGDITKGYVEIFQADNGLKETGIVDKSTWDKLMEKLTQEQNYYFETVANQKGIKLETIKKLIEYGKDELNDKEELFVNSMSKFLMILLGQDPYPGIYDKYTYKRGINYDVEQEFGEDLEKIISDYTKVQYGDVGSEFRFVIEDYKKLGELKGEIKKGEYSKNRPSGTLITSYHKGMEEQIKVLEKKIETKNEKAEGFRENYPSLFRSDQEVDVELKKQDKEKYFDSRKEQDQRTIHGLFEKIYNEFKIAIKDKSYSLDEISNIVFMINNTIYKLFNDTTMTDKTTLSKTKRAIKGILEMVANAKDREEMFEFVLNITDPYKVKAYEYELSFCECGDGEYFKCDSLGDRSTIIPNSRKRMIELITSNKRVDECVKELYNKIGEEAGKNIDKYDIITQKEIVLEGGHTIQPKTKIEVKRTDIDKPQYHFLSEFFGVYKSSYNIEHYSDKYAYDRYNEIVSGLVEKLNEKGDFGIIEKVEEDMGGLFLEKYYYYPKGHFKLVWGDTSRGTLTDEKRVVIRYELIGEGYRWVEGNCNIPDHQDMTNESIDKYISEVLGF